MIPGRGELGVEKREEEREYQRLELGRTSAAHAPDQPRRMRARKWRLNVRAAPGWAGL